MLLFFEFYLFFYIAIVMHELGHWVAAWLLGIPTVGLVVGHGSPIVDKVWRGERFSFHAWPFGGHVKPAWPVRRRWKFITICLAGPAANALMLLLVYWLHGEEWMKAALIMLVVINLNPLDPSCDGGQVWAARRWTKIEKPTSWS